MTKSSWLKSILPRRQGPGQPPGLAPVIILGMHRSGTSMICKMLEQAGLFVGAAKDPNNEATYFLRLNEWVLTQAGARWDTPEHLTKLLANDDLVEKVVHQLRQGMGTPACAEYLSFKLYRRHGGLQSLAVPWGWKDPRTTLTLPLWLKVFPQARLIYIRRHGTDVAASLR